MQPSGTIHKTELVVLGGEPQFRETLHVGRPNIGSRDALLARIEDILDRRWFTNNGPMVQEFEARLKSVLGVRHCVAVCNATVGLELTVRALKLEGEVIVPSFTFIATPHALQWQEITPVFCDVDPQTHCIDPEKIEQMITPRTTGIIGVHVWGRPCAIDALTSIAERRGLKLVFDAAHAFACSHRGTMIGNFGNAEVFSFHATKFLNTFEGGAIATNDDALAAKLRLMKNFGFSGLDEVTYIGTNGKMTEMSAAMGLTSLESMHELIAKNRENYRHYVSELSDIPGATVHTYDENDDPNYQYIVVDIDREQTILSRNEIVQVLRLENVAARRYFHPGCHRMEPYRSYFPHAGLLLPVTESLTERLLLLPNGTSIEEEHIRKIGAIIRTAVNNAHEIRRALVAAQEGT
jgi:dTDP-4-amino-4,6-dideoxygalactose transaminase